MWLIISNTGNIKMYTFGWPKNQNKCWYKAGSPPPIYSKKFIPRFRSVNNIVIPQTKTGNDSKSKMAVIKEAHTNKGNRENVNPPALIFIMVVIKFITSAIDAAPAARYAS
jgi:hypothetical protein